MKTPFEHFKTDTSVVQIEENLYEGNLSDRWSIGKTPNGGYTMACLLYTSPSPRD